MIKVTFVSYYINSEKLDKWRWLIITWIYILLELFKWSTVRTKSLQLNCNLTLCCNSWVAETAFKLQQQIKNAPSVACQTLYKIIEISIKTIYKQIITIRACIFYKFFLPNKTKKLQLHYSNILYENTF